jgi:hypothetical protein
MKTAKIDLKVTSSRKNSVPSYSENKGRVVTFVDNDEQYIAVDAFQDVFSKLERREVSEIQIYANGKSWTGSFDELTKKLGLVSEPEWHEHKTKILQHTILFHYDNDKQDFLSAENEEDINYQIGEGSSEGEIDFETEKNVNINGYWKIKK